MKKKAIVMLIVSLLLIAVMVIVSFLLIQENFTSAKTSANYIYPTFNPKEGQKIVSICFDDGWLSTYFNATPILDQYGFKASFAIITKYADNNYPAYMNWIDIENLSRNGQDIESHSYNHLSLATLDNASIIYQLSQSKQDLNNHNIKPGIFVYPNGSGSRNATVENLVQKYYFAARGITTEQLNITQSFDKFALPCHVITNKTTTADFEKIVNQANNSTVEIIVYHKIDGENVDTATTPQMFASQMQYLKENNFTVVTMQQLVMSSTHN